MLYKSTRSQEKAAASAAQVIKQGLAEDGGLFVPESIPSLTKDEILTLCKESYPVRAAKILAKFLTDYTYEELLAFDFGSKFGEKFKGLKILKFEEILKKLACHTVMNIHIKTVV